MNDREHQIHNAFGPELFKSIVQCNDNQYGPSMVMLESIVYGVCLLFERLEYIPPEVSLAALVEGVNLRLKEKS